jgi:hypothetical protein
MLRMERAMITDKTLLKRQQRLASTESLGSYAGQWVALREGRVIASARTLRALRSQTDLRANDVLRKVPSTFRPAIY